MAAQCGGLRFELHRENQLAFGDDNEIPLFRGSKVPGKFHGGSRPDIKAIQASFAQDVGNQHFERPNCVPPVTSPRVPASILPDSTCFALFSPRASQ